MTTVTQCGTNVNKPQPNSLPVMAPRTFVHARRDICNPCEQSVRGVCEVVEQEHPGRAQIEKGIRRPELRCPLGKWETEPHPCPSCGRITREMGDCRPCTNKKRLDKNFHTRKGQRAFQSAFTANGAPRWITVARFQSDALRLASMVPPETDTIVGVARSGLAAATIVSMVTHLPLVAIRQNKHDLIEVGNGWRLGGQDHISAGKNAFVVDDTVMTGNSLNAIGHIAQRNFDRVTFGAVYANPLAVRKPDVVVEELGWPHLLEWNVFNSVLSPNMALDFDGVICHDPPRRFTDDATHLEWIENAVPRYLPRKVPVPLIVTARLEKYRDATVAWLRKHRVQFHKLIMHPAKTLAERDRSDIASYKAKHFNSWAAGHRPRPKPLMFVESDPNQARSIHQRTRRMVVCPNSGEVFD